MKVKLLKDVISLDNIHSIGEIETYYPTTGGGRYLYAGLPVTLRFTIEMYNDKKIEVNKAGNYIPSNLFTKHDYETGHPYDSAIKRIGERYKKSTQFQEDLADIKGVRNELINLWSNHQPEIPEIGFKK